MARHRHDPFKDLVGFLVGDVMYAVRIDVVREIVNPLEIVDLPRAPSSVKGVADYRGDVVPVIDLRERFGLPPASTRKTKWVVLDVTGGRNPNGHARKPFYAGQSAATVVGPAAGGPLAGPTGDGAAPWSSPGSSREPASGAGKGSAVLAGAEASRPLLQGRFAALVVDSMTEVFGLAGGELRPAPPLGDGDDRRGIEGVTTLGSRLVFVLDARAFGVLAASALSPSASAKLVSSSSGNA